MRKQKERRSLGETLADAAELPKDIVLGVPKITLLFGSGATVENHKGIIDYTESAVRLYSSAGIITLRGEALTITAITDEDITVSGHVCGVFCE